MDHRFVSIRLLEADIEAIIEGLKLLKPYCRTAQEGGKAYSEFLIECIKTQTKRR